MRRAIADQTFDEKRRKMDFRNINKFNRLVNIWSTNFFPVVGEKSGIGFLRASALTIIWIIKGLYIIFTAIGVKYTTIFLALRDGGICAIDSFEIVTLTLWINIHRARLHDIISKINSILAQTERMKELIRVTVDPMKERMKIYTVVTLLSTFSWAAMPITRILEKDTFTYTDFVLSTYFPGEPFGVKVFALGVFLDTFAGTYVFFNKNSIDVYVSYLVTVLTAEFRYISEQVTGILARNDDDHESVLRDLRKCVDDHCVAMDAGNLLMEQMYPNCGVTYLNCVLRFCLLAFGLSVVEGAYVEKTIYVVFTIGNFVQVYFFCSCVQDLLEASTSITDDAFHEDWYGRGSQVRAFFQTMGLSNRMECRLSAFRIVDLTIPSFAAILNHAYSAYLLLLGMHG